MISRHHKHYRSRASSSRGGAAAALLLTLMLFAYRNLIAILFLVFALAVVVGFIVHDRQYKKTSYYKVTGRSYFTVRRDLGLYGEYLTYKHLQYLEEQSAKFLFNVYIPKENGETSEIDVLMICRKGLFVFESKNYSGWIFGSESQANWYQTLPSGKKKSHKEHFYNPVMQNQGHIKHLASFLGEEIPMHSVIVFSDRCTLKNVQMTSTNISVINRSDVASAVTVAYARTPDEVLDDDRIAQIYDLLYPFTQVDAAAKAQHIANIQKHTNPHPTEPAAPVDTPILTTENDMPVTESLPEVQADTATEGIGEIAVESVPSIPKCPRCNSDLVLRTASRGANAGNQFYGCSNFPKCRYIQNITKNDNETDT